MYRDDYDALQTRADTLHRDLEELRTSSSQDDEKIAKLTRELATTTKALKAANQRLGLAPKKPKTIMLLGALSLFLFFAGLMAYFQYSQAKFAVRESFLQT